MKRGEKATALSVATMFIASMPVLDFFICPIDLVYPCVWSISPEELGWGWSPILPISPGFQLVLATEEAAEMGWGGRLWVVIPPTSSCRVRTVMLPSLVPEDSLAADFYVSVRFCMSSPACLGWLELSMTLLLESWQSTSSGPHLCCVDADLTLQLCLGTTTGAWKYYK